MEQSGVEEGLSNHKEGVMYCVGSVSQLMVGFKAVIIVTCSPNVVRTPESPTSGMFNFEKQFLLRQYRRNRPDV